MSTFAGTASAAPAAATILAARAGRAALVDHSFRLAPDGVWLASTNPKAVFRAGCTYVGYVTAAGVVGVAKYDHASGRTQTAELTAREFSVDDHGCPSLHFRRDGRLVLFYSQHNDAVGLRYRISTQAESIDDWGAEQVIAGGMVTYSNPRFLPAAGRLFLFYRLGDEQMLRYSTDDGDSWSAPQIVFTTTRGLRPYPYAVVTAPDRIDVLVVQGGPMHERTSIHHCCARWRSGTLQWQRSDGAPVALPIRLEGLAKVHDAASASGIWEDLAPGPDGKLWAVFARLDGPGGCAYLFSKLDGGHWSEPVPLADGGYPLYAEQWDFCGGVAFDRRNPAVCYVSSGLSPNGPWELAEWRTSDLGRSWTKARDITAGFGPGMANMRPESVIDHDGRAAVVFCSGRYNSFADYQTSLRAVASARIEQTLKNAAGVALPGCRGLRYTVLDAAALLNGTETVLASGDDGCTDADGVFHAAIPGAAGTVFLSLAAADDEPAALPRWAGPSAVI